MAQAGIVEGSCLAGKTVTLTGSIRVIIDVASLNMSGSVGNVVRARKAPVVVKEGRGGAGVYKILMVPVVSGMSIAHGYQRLLASIAHSMGLPVTGMSLNGYFLKFPGKVQDERNRKVDLIEQYYPEVSREYKELLQKHGGNPEKLVVELEKLFVSADTVADVGGFLYAGAVPVKRTSRASFSYLIPASIESDKFAASVISQIHARYTPTAQAGGQVIYNVEVESAVYTLTFQLDVSGVGKLEYGSIADGRTLHLEDSLKRAEAAVKALAALLDSMSFGAKRSRSLPQWRVESLVAAGTVGSVPFTATPGFSKDYIAETVNRAEALKRQGVLYSYAVYHYRDPTLGDDVEARGAAAESVAEALMEAFKAAVGGAGCER